MEQKQVTANVEITLSKDSLPEDQIRRAITGLNLGERVFIQCENIFPSQTSPGLEAFSYWYNPLLVYSWFSKNWIVREMWKAEQLIVAHKRMTGESK